MQQNTDQKSSEYGQFLRSGRVRPHSECGSSQNNPHMQIHKACGYKKNKDGKQSINFCFVLLITTSFTYTLHIQHEG